MTWFRKRPSVPPSGVRLVRADGSEVPCDVLREPDGDSRRMTAWIAVPREPGLVARQGDALQIDALPPRTVIEFRMTLPAPSPHDW